MSTVQITLKQRLKAFADSDTTSESKGFFEEGDYALTDFKKDFPNKNTDYAQIETASKGKVWICVRWQENNYVDLQSSPERPEQGEQGKPLDVSQLASLFKQGAEEEPKTENSFDGDDSAVDENELIKLLDQFDDFDYDLKDPAYPFELKGINVPQTPPKPKQNNCVLLWRGFW